jgi:hypothetical protein
MPWPWWRTSTRRCIEDVRLFFCESKTLTYLTMFSCTYCCVNKCVILLSKWVTLNAAPVYHTLHHSTHTAATLLASHWTALLLTIFSFKSPSVLNPSKRFLNVRCVFKLITYGCESSVNEASKPNKKYTQNVRLHSLLEECYRPFNKHRPL